jgi:hypothetical protein
MGTPMQECESEESYNRLDIARTIRTKLELSSRLQNFNSLQLHLHFYSILSFAFHLGSSVMALCTHTIIYAFR